MGLLVLDRRSVARTIQSGTSQMRQVFPDWADAELIEVTDIGRGIVKLSGGEQISISFPGTGASAIGKGTKGLIRFVRRGNRQFPSWRTCCGVGKTNSDAPTPALLSIWRRLGNSQSHRFYQLGKDVNNESYILVSGRTLSDAVTAQIVRVKNELLIYSNDNLITTLDTTDNSSTVADVTEDVTCLDIGEVTGAVNWLTHGTQVVAVPLGCEEATALGYDDGYALGLGDWFLFNDGAFDCANGDGYAWVDFGYESNILDGEDNASSFYNWSLPGDVEFEENADDCYRAGLVEGARVAYDEGSTDEGCGS